MVNPFVYVFLGLGIINIILPIVCWSEIKQGKGSRSDIKTFLIIQFSTGILVTLGAVIYLGRHLLR